MTVEPCFHLCHEYNQPENARECLKWKFQIKFNFTWKQKSQVYFAFFFDTNDFLCPSSEKLFPNIWLKRLFQKEKLLFWVNPL